MWIKIEESNKFGFQDGLKFNKYILYKEQEILFVESKDVGIHDVLKLNKYVYTKNNIFLWNQNMLKSVMD